MDGRGDGPANSAEATAPDAGALDPDEWNDPAPDVIEPGRPDPENVAFVVLGALGALYVIARVAGLV